MPQDGNAQNDELNAKPGNKQNKFDQLRNLQLFKGCPDRFIAELSSIAVFHSAPLGCPVLLEGQANDNLYVLASGSVEVLVDGERVAVLDTPGDLMGEISLITSGPASASIITLTPIEYYAIGMKHLADLVASSAGEFGYYMYQSLSSVVAEKIVKTNDKARRFEMANRALVAAMQSLEEANRTLDLKVQERTRDLEQKTVELTHSYQALEARNLELVASHRKLEDLYSSKEMTFKKLNQLNDYYLSPLHETLSDLEKGSTETDRPRIERAKSQVANSIEMLRPLTELYSTEQAIRSRRVLLAESDRKQQVLAKLALGGTGVHLDMVSTIADGISICQEAGKFDLVFLGSELVPLAPHVRQFCPSAKLVYMASSHVPSELPLLRQHSQIISNIVSRHAEDRTFTIKNVMTTVSKLIAQDIFGLEKYLTWGVEVQSRSIKSSSQRTELLQEMQDHFAQLGVRSTISERAATVAEEMLMNAIYDAPHTPEGKPLYNHLPRTKIVELAKNEFGELRYACDGMFAAVSVSDPFGGFRIETLLSYLERNYAPSGETQVGNKGGAGRGLHQIIENSDLVVFNIKRNVRTEVVALFNLDVKAVDGSAKPSFHFFCD